MIIEVIVKYWVQWVCALIAGGVVFFARRYIKLERKALEDKWAEREKKAKDYVLQKFSDERDKEVALLRDEDKKIRADIEAIYLALDNNTKGLLSI